MAASRLEIAHFWGDECLYISVHEGETAAERWLDAGPTRIRMRPVARVATIHGTFELATWGPFLLLLGSFFAALFSESPGNEGDWSLETIPVLRSAQSDVWDWPVRLDAHATRGYVLQIANGTRATLHVACADATVNTRRVLSPGDVLRAVPASLAGCWFSTDEVGWSYELQIDSRELKSQRRRATTLDESGPYLFFLEVDEERILRRAEGQSFRFAALPLPHRGTPAERSA